jgi:hypothetical protein
MNERIKELAEQCVGDRPYNNSFDYEKFAELIVEDIMQELFINGYEDAFDHLNKYFGVEE